MEEKSDIRYRGAKDKVIASGLRAIDLVRLCGISAPTAYKFFNSEPLSANALHKIYLGLKDEAGLTLEDVLSA